MSSENTRLDLNETLDLHFDRIEKYKMRAAMELAETFIHECTRRLPRQLEPVEQRDVVADVALAIRPLL